MEILLSILNLTLNPIWCVMPFYQFVFRFLAIHQEAPEFVEMNVAQEILETGIKVVDLLAPYAKGGKIGRLIEIIMLFLCWIEASVD